MTREELLFTGLTVGIVLMCALLMALFGNFGAVLAGMVLGALAGYYLGWLNAKRQPRWAGPTLDTPPDHQQGSGGGQGGAGRNGQKSATYADIRPPVTQVSNSPVSNEW